ncbi:MAG: hypothetical protein AAFX09_08485 [Pseudomonadota bacterium]
MDDADTRIALSRLAVLLDNAHADEALDGFSALCDGGVQIACMEVEEISLLAAAPSDPADARAYYAQACDAGQAPACTQLGIMLDSIEGGERDLLGSRAALVAACRGRHREGCVRLAGQLYTGIGGPDDLETARRLAGTACSQGDARGCWALGGFFDNENRHGEALVLFETACNGGFERGCYTLFFRRGQIASEEGRLGEAYENFASACDRDEGFRGWVCNMAADLALLTDNPNADPVLSQAHRERACALNFTLACRTLEDTP